MPKLTVPKLTVPRLTQGRLAHIVPPALMEAAESGRRRKALQMARQQLQSADKLNLGCGTTIRDGWANIDLRPQPGVIALDLSWGLPVDDDTIAAVYIEHMIEEMTQPDAIALLTDIRRVLRPGGVLRASTPDLAALIEEYSNDRITYWESVGWSPATRCDMVNEGMRFWGNQYVYDRDALDALLAGIGFSDVRYVDWHESEHEHLRQLETRPYRRELIVEATK